MTELKVFLIISIALQSQYTEENNQHDDSRILYDFFTVCANSALN